MSRDWHTDAARTIGTLGQVTRAWHCSGGLCSDITPVSVRGCAVPLWRCRAVPADRLSDGSLWQSDNTYEAFTVTSLGTSEALCVNTWFSFTFYFSMYGSWLCVCMCSTCVAGACGSQTTALTSWNYSYRCCEPPCGAGNQTRQQVL